MFVQTVDGARQRPLRERPANPHLAEMPGHE